MTDNWPHGATCASFRGFVLPADLHTCMPSACRACPLLLLLNLSDPLSPTTFQQARLLSSPHEPLLLPLSPSQHSQLQSIWLLWECAICVAVKGAGFKFWNCHLLILSFHIFKMGIMPVETKTANDHTVRLHFPAFSIVMEDHGINDRQWTMSRCYEDNLSYWPLMKPQPLCQVKAV